MPYKDVKKQRRAKLEWARTSRTKKKIIEKITLIKELTIEEPKSDEEFTFGLEKSILSDLLDIGESLSATLAHVDSLYRTTLNKLTYSSQEDYIEKTEKLINQQIFFLNSNLALCDTILLHPEVSLELKDTVEGIHQRLEKSKVHCMSGLDNFLRLKEQDLVPYMDPKDFAEVEKE
jgi:hypothetical protein